MHRFAFILGLGILVASQITVACAQGDPKSLVNREEREEPPQLKLSVSETDIAILEAEHRYRMIWQMIGFILLLVFLHFVQVKLKINRGYFWFMVCTVIFLYALNSNRPKYDPNKSRLPLSDPPTYAPMHAR